MTKSGWTNPPPDPPAPDPLVDVGAALAWAREDMRRNPSLWVEAVREVDKHLEHWLSSAGPLHVYEPGSRKPREDPP